MIQLLLTNILIKFSLQKLELQLNVREILYQSFIHRLIANEFDKIGHPSIYLNLNLNFSSESC